MIGRSSRVVGAAALVMACACSCSYDWSTGSPPSGSDAGDAGFAGDAADSAPNDAEADVGGDSTPMPDAPADGPSCAQLHANVDSTRAAARHCTSQPNDCQAKLEDECMCTLFVAQSSSQATADYKAAIAALVASGCSLGCATCPTPPTQSFCTASSGADGGLTTTCNP
jgi:hypothetical protein